MAELVELMVELIEAIEAVGPQSELLLFLAASCSPRTLTGDPCDSAQIACSNDPSELSENLGGVLWDLDCKLSSVSLLSLVTIWWFSSFASDGLLCDLADKSSLSAASFMVDCFDTSCWFSSCSSDSLHLDGGETSVIMDLLWDGAEAPLIMECPKLLWDCTESSLIMECSNLLWNGAEVSLIMECPNLLWDGAEDSLMKECPLTSC